MKLGITNWLNEHVSLLRFLEDIFLLLTTIFRWLCDTNTRRKKKLFLSSSSGKESKETKQTQCFIRLFLNLCEGSASNTNEFSIV